MPAKALLSEAVKPPDSWVCSAGVLRSTPGSSEIQVSENSTSFIAGDSGLAWGFRRKKTRSRSPCEKWSFVHGKEHKRRWLKKGAERPSPSDLDVAAEQLTWAIPGSHFPRNLNNSGHVANRQPVISANF